MRKLLPSLAVLFAISVASFAGGYAFAQRGDHGEHSHFGKLVPKEAGQSGFAAIAEIVQILSDDPDTDWSKVNINGLREHLVDMSALTLGAEVKIEVVDDQVRFIASGEDTKTIKALQNMVPAHSKELDKMPEWSALGTATELGAVLAIEPVEKISLPKIQALGFFGLMTTGAHHQPHHLGMASGKFDHQH